MARLGRWCLAGGLLVAACAGEESPTADDGSSGSGIAGNGPAAQGRSGSTVGEPSDGNAGRVGGGGGVADPEAGSGGMAGSVAGSGGTTGSVAGSAGAAGSIAGNAGSPNAHGGNGGRAGLQFVVEPQLVGNDNWRAPLAAILTLQANLPCTGSALVSGGGEAWSLPLAARAG